MTETLTPTETPKSKVTTQKMATKNFDYTTIADRTRTISLGNDNNQRTNMKMPYRMRGRHLLGKKNHVKIHENPKTKSELKVN